jgi:hypothetical protein
MFQAPPQFNVLVAVIQTVLLLAGLVLGIVSLALGKGRPGTGRWPALAGLALSAYPLGLIVGLTIRNL